MKADSKVFCGGFDAERFWRPEFLARLPSAPALSRHGAIRALDQLLIPLCRPGDFVLLSDGIDDAHAEYWHSIKHNCSFNKGSFAKLGQALEEARTIFTDISMHRVAFDRKNSATTATLVPFAVVPGCLEAARILDLSFPCPGMNTIVQVNSKSYSTMLRKKVGILDYGHIVGNLGELQATGTLLLREGPFVLKDEFGVSGGGSLVISSEENLNRIIRHLKPQVEANKNISFILEPALPRMLDFSARMLIKDDGQLCEQSVSLMRNKGFAFAGSYAVSSAFERMLDKSNYYDVISRVAASLYNDGYFGYVCVDSMVLRDHTIAEVVEINARMSMGTIRDALERDYCQPQGSARLNVLHCLKDKAVTIDNIINSLETAGLLFSKRRETGLIPLSSGGFFDRAGASPRQGRFYIATIANSVVGHHNLLTKAFAVLEHLGVRVFR